MKNTIIVDIDGTIAKVGDRLKHIIGPGKKDYDKFYNRCGEDEPINEICELVKCMINQDYSIVYCTGRRESMRDITTKWLKDNNLYVEGIEMLLMRPDNDYRHDTIVKFEMIEQTTIKYDDILFVLEDRDSMVKAWRERGVKCLQVSEGNF